MRSPRCSAELEDRQKYSNPGLRTLPAGKRQRPHLIDRFMPQLRECVRNRYTPGNGRSSETIRLQRLVWRGPSPFTRRSREGLPEPQVFVSRKDACRLLWQWPVTRPNDTIDVSYLLVRYEDLAIPFCFIQGFREAIRERDAGHLLSLFTQSTSHITSRTEAFRGSPQTKCRGDPGGLSV